MKRISLFNDRNDYFDYILSPTDHIDQKNIFCKKKGWISWNPYFKDIQLRYWVAKDFLKAITKISKTCKKIKIVVLDDAHLLEACTLIKNSSGIEMELIFSYHGHFMEISSKILEKTDKVLFLTKAGYLETIKKSKQFTPEAHIIGNGVDSNYFFPVEKNIKHSLRANKGFSKDDIIITWMANSRPVKGLHIFLKVALKLVLIEPRIKIVVIGQSGDLQISHPRIYNIGRIKHDQLPEYLQISDFYFFTSLWKEGFGLSLVEAIKCGNIAIASKTGGIPSVLENVFQKVFVNEPNVIEAWVAAFEEAKIIEAQKDNWFSSFSFSNFHSFEIWERNFLTALA